jgi:hypothetical protein
MRIDRIYSEGEAVNALQQIGFHCIQLPYRENQYIISHPQIGGERTFTIAQLCNFAEGATVLVDYFNEIRQNASTSSSK